MKIEAGRRGSEEMRVSMYPAKNNESIPRLKHTGIYGVRHPEGACAD